MLARRIRSPEALARLKRQRKERYDDRKSRQACIDCNAKLEEDDGLRCAGCDTRDKQAKALRLLTTRGQATHLRSQRRLRARRKKEGKCAACATGKAECGLICKRCRKLQTDAARRYRARKAAGIVVLVTERKRRRRLKRAELEAKINPVVDPMDRPLVDRILVALRFLDWTDPVDILDMVGVGRGVERKNLTVIVSRDMMRDGYLERRVSDGNGISEGCSQYEYRLTPAGIAASNARRYA